jgi:hypothetical protein
VLDEVRCEAYVTQGGKRFAETIVMMDSFVKSGLFSCGACGASTVGLLMSFL